MSETLKFSIKYDGSALVNHEMDVRELAPALLALSDLIKAASRVLHGDKSDVQINVQGNFKGGSFGVDLSAAQTFYEQIASLLAGQGPTAAANLTAILSAIGLLGSGGVIKLVKALRGKKPSKIEYKDNKAILTILDSEIVETLEVDLNTGKLWQDRSVRQSLYQVFKPLSQDGIDVFASGRTSEPEAVVTKEEAAWFACDDTAIELNSTVIEQVCLIESVAFKGDNKWKLNNGQTFYAVMDDVDFLAGIESGEIRFGKGDRLRVTIEISQQEKGNKIEISHRILKVLEHKISHQSTLFN